MRTFAITVHPTSTCDPACQTAWGGIAGRSLPRSPRKATLEFWKMAPAPPLPWPGWRPPAMPQASMMGAAPGERHGLQ